MTAPFALEIDNLSSGYGESVVVRDISLQVRPGEIFAILGKNGMGKSTLLKTVMGFLRPKAGRIRLMAQDVTHLATHLLARRRIGYAPQEQTLFQDLTVEENLRLGLRADKDFEPGLKAVRDYFPVISQRLRQRAGTLSGGEQKMLLAMRTLIAQPDVVLVDEISEGLQPSLIQRLAEVFRAERERRGLTLLLVEQNVPFATSIADSYAILKIGEITEQGSVADAQSAQAIMQHLSI